MTTIQVRRGTAAAWTSANPVLGAGETGFETDTGLTKVGDGSTAWASLVYSVPKNLTSTSVTSGTPASGDTVLGLVSGALKRFAARLMQDTWLGGLTGEVARSFSAHLADQGVSVKTFGAKGDGTTDDRAAFQACNDYCAANGKSMSVPSPSVYYRIRGTVTITCRHVFGEASWFSSGDLGTRLHFDPASITDFAPCLDCQGNDNALVENLSITGPHSYSTATLASASVVTAGSLPAIGAFSAGVAAFRTSGSGKVTFRNCTTDNSVKVGLLIDSNNGHVSPSNCIFAGLFGVYARISSEDFFFSQCGFNGAWANVVFGDTLYSNHYGGFHGAFQRTHFYGSPFCFYQVKDNVTDTSGQSVIGGLQASFYSCAFEQVGEAAAELLSNSLSRLLIAGCSHAWTSAAGAPLLPTAIRATRQAYWWKLGFLDSFRVLQGFNTANQAGVPAGTAGVGKSLSADFSRLAVALDAEEMIYLTQGGAGFDATNVPNDTPVAPDAFGARPGFVEHRALSAGAAIPGNLLLDPEYQTAGAGVADNMLTSNGGDWRVLGGGGTTPHITGNTYSGWAGTLSGTPIPRKMAQELGGNPWVVGIIPDADNTTMATRLDFIGNPLIEATRFVGVSLWFCNANCEARLAGATGGTYVYDRTVSKVAGSWQKFVGVGKQISSPATNGYARLEIVLPGTTPLYVAGVQAFYDDLQPYSRYPVAKYVPYGSDPADANSIWSHATGLLLKSGTAIATAFNSVLSTLNATIQGIGVGGATASANNVALPSGGFLKVAAANFLEFNASWANFWLPVYIQNTNAVIRAGTGVPSANEHAGSLYLRDGKAPYGKVDGSTLGWVRIRCPYLSDYGTTSTLSVNGDDGTTFKSSPVGNVTVAAPVNLQAEELYTFRLIQDATGGRTYTWNAAFKKGSANLSASWSDTGNTASKVRTVVFVALSATTADLVSDSGWN